MVQHLSLPRLTNVLRAWIEQAGAAAPSTKVLRCLLDEMIMVDEGQSPCVAWSGVMVRRYRGVLYLLQHANTQASSQALPWLNFPEPLSVGPRQQWVATPAQHGLHVPKSACVEIRYREGGEHMVWRGHRRVLKKLWQAWGVPPWLRDKIPLIYIDGQLAAVLDFCVADLYYREHGERVYNVGEQWG